MALLHEATISPRKDELVGPWLPTRSWFDGEAERGPVSSFRLDDPAGQVGIECFLFGSAVGSVLFVPLTYREAPLPGAESGLIGTMEHSVLGTRYVYDACVDPVFVATVVRGGRCQADLRLRRADGTEVEREATATARGDGSADVSHHDPAVAVSWVDAADRTTITGATVELTVMRRPSPAPRAPVPRAPTPTGPTLTGSFEGGTDLRLVIVSG